MVYTLRKPVMFEGNEIGELTYDLDELTARDVLNVQMQMRQAGCELKPSMLIDEPVLAGCVAVAGGLPAAFVLSLRAADYVSIVNVAQDFFGSAASGL